MPTGRAAAAPPSRFELIYRLIVFDLDGTLVDSADDLTASVNASLAEHGLDRLPAAMVLGFVGHGGRTLVERSVKAVAPDADDARVTEVLTTFLARYRRHCLDRTRLYPGVEDLVRTLRSVGAELAVLTNKPRAPSEAILEGLGVRSAFRAVVAGDDLPTRKPDPEGLEWLRVQAGCDRRDVVLVGDSTVDLETARRARVDSCAVTWGFGDEYGLRAAQPTLVARHPADVVRLLEGGAPRSG